MIDVVKRREKEEQGAVSLLNCARGARLSLSSNCGLQSGVELGSVQKWGARFALSINVRTLPSLQRVLSVLGTASQSWADEG